MPARSSFDYAIVRVVPRVDREEFVNVGVIVYCLERDFLVAKIELDEQRLCSFAPNVDLSLVKPHLDSFTKIAAGGKDAGPIGQLPQKDRWHWLVAPRSTIIQTSAVHSGIAESPETAVEKLLDKVVRPPKPPSSNQKP
ncbi:MAG: DUF3037 domain-containing protein [Myxococcaceae bacterium]